ncbi:MAG: hypothetical protein ACO1QS_18890 [Verrucomicrobiota bacterium]
MNTPDLGIIATAWLTGLGYVLAVCLRLRQGRWTPWAARCWFFGACMMLIHVLAAFHFRHQWSHAAAVIDTARQTKELIGWEWGGGVWLNYLLVLIWLGDALWLTLAESNYVIRAKWLSVAVQGYLAFMWFNATVVFGGWGAKVFGVIAIAGCSWMKRKK